MKRIPVSFLLVAAAWASVPGSVLRAQGSPAEVAPPYRAEAELRSLLLSRPPPGHREPAFNLGARWRRGPMGSKLGRGMLGGFLGAAAGSVLGVMLGGADESDYNEITAYAIMAGFWAGTTWGVWSAGRRSGQHSSVASTAAGAVFGSAIGMTAGLAFLYASPDLDDFGPAAVVVLGTFGGSSLGATIGYNVKIQDP